MVRQNPQLNGYEFEQTLGDGEGQGSLACCSPWDLSVGLDLVTEQQQQALYLSNGCTLIYKYFIVTSAVI